MSDDLKPCPFCGGKADIIYMNMFGIYRITCNNCWLCVEDSFAPTRVSKDTLIAWWNRRVKN